MIVAHAWSPFTAAVGRARRRWRVKPSSVSLLPGREESGQPRWRTYPAAKCLSATWHVSWASLTQEIHDPAEIEREVLRHLNQRRTLIVLDNAETLVEAVKANTEAAIGLAQLLREHLASPSVSLLVTSREFLGWDGEVGLEHDLEGLAPEEGARLFQQAAPQRVSDAELALAAELSQKVDGHPLSLRLLGGAFNESAISLPAFVKDCEAHLLHAENKYVGAEHRHRTLYACIDTSVRYLDDELD